MPVTLATWNINSVRLRIRLVTRFLRTFQPDILCLQEIKCLAEQFPARTLARAGYPYQAVHGQKGYHGVAIVSRFPLTDITSRLFCEIDHARHVSARVDFGRGPVALHNFYIPAGGHEPDPLVNPKFKHKLDFLSELKSWFGEAAFADRQIICGDFNIVPTPMDGWKGADADGDIFHTDKERTQLARLMSTGLHDLYRVHAPDEQAFSWWDYRGGAFHRKQGLRIDFVLATDAVKDRLKDATIDRDYRKKKDGLTASDHAPVIAEIE